MGKGTVMPAFEFEFRSIMSKSHEVTAWIDLNIIEKAWGKSLPKELDEKKSKYLIESMPVPYTITWLVSSSRPVRLADLHRL